MSSLPSLPDYVLTLAQRDDAEEWAVLEALPQVREHTSSTIMSTADLMPIIERSLSNDPTAPIHFVVRESLTLRLVASVGFHSISVVNRTAEVTYGVHPSMWGKGLATDLCKVAVQWGFHCKSWVRIQATTLESNQASQRVLHKAGFALEGKLRHLRLVQGIPRDYLMFSIIPAVLT